MTYTFLHYSSVDSNFVYVVSLPISEQVGPSQNINLRFTTDRFLVFLQEATSTKATKSQLVDSFKNKSGPIWQAMQNLLDKSYMVRMTTEQPLNRDYKWIEDAKPTKASTNQTSNPSDWPLPEFTSPFTPIRQPFLPGYDSGFRIGYAVIKAPVTYFHYDRSTYIKETGGLRNPDSIKTSAGRAYESYTVQYVASGPYEIEKYVKEVLEQITINPFVCVEGGPFGRRDERGEIPAKELAISSYTISTIPNHPNQILVQINCEPYVWNWWSPQTEPNEKGYDRELLDDAICYPLYKLWCKEAGRSHYRGGNLNGKFTLSFPTAESLNLAKSVLPTITGNEDGLVDSLKALREKRYRDASSDLVKEINGGGNRYFAIKAQSPEMFAALTGYEFNGTDWVRTKGTTFVGLIEWNKIDYKLANLYGDRIPHSSLINITSGSNGALKKVPTNQSFLDISTSSTNLSSDLEIYLTAEATKRFSIQYSGAELTSKVNAQVAQDLAVLKQHPYYRFALVLQDDTTFVSPKPPAFSTVIENNVKVVERVESLEDLIATASSVPKAINPHLELGSFLNYNDTVLSLDGTGDLVIEQISGSRQHTLSRLSTDATPLPLHQYLGSLGSVITVTGKAFGKKALEKLVRVKTEFDTRAQNKPSSKFDPNPDKEIESLGDQFLHVDNEIFNLLGVEFVMPVDLTYETIDQQPNCYNFVFQFIEYTPKLKAGEKVKYLPTFNQTNQNVLDFFNKSGDSFTHPTKLKALDYFSLQGALKQEEAYPDLYLPTKDKLNSWIGSCIRLAKSRTDPQIQLSPDDKLVDSVISEYLDDPLFRFNRDLMSSWAKFDSNGIYVDPDFYVYYSSNDSFHNLLEKIAEEVLGKRNGLSGSAESAKVSMRLHDTEYKVISVDAPHNHSAAKSTAAEEIKERQDNTFWAGTRFKATELFEQEEEIRVQREEIGKGLGWWLTGQEVIKAKGLKIVPIDSKIFNQEQNSIIPFDASAEQDKAKDGIQPDDVDVTRVGLTYQDFFKIEWRRSQLEKWAATGRQNPSTIRFDQTSPKTLFNLYSPETFFIWGASISSGLRFTGSNSDILYFNPTGLISATPKPRFPTLTEYVDFYRQEDKIGYDPNNNPALSIPFLPRVKYINAAFEKRKSLSNEIVPFDNSGSIIEKAAKNRKVFDSVGWKYQVDPNLLRAYFIVRSGFGTVNSIDNLNTNGWGEIDSTGLQIDPTKPEQAIEKFGQIYSEKIAKFKYPTLALIATDVILTKKTVPANFDELLTNISKLPKKQAGFEINNLLKSLGPKFQVMDYYYTSWVECCRVFGPIINTRIASTDPYFYPTNPLIVLDVGRNGEGRTAMTSVTPSGNSALIRLSRRDLGQNSFNELQDTLNKNVSPEQQVLLNNRQKVALAPSSEDAVWGMMYDMRAYSPHGRLLGSYPSFCVLFINEGFYWLGGGQKLWDQHYTRTNLTAIEVFKSRKEASHTATVTLTNVFHQLTQYTAQEAMLHNMALDNRQKLYKSILENPAGSLGDVFSTFVLKNISDRMKETWQRNYMNLFVLGAGARLHIRMGYGSNLAKLPVVFNGKVVEAPVSQDAVTLIAVGDGGELENPAVSRLNKTQQGWFYRDGGALFGSGKSPANIITDALVNIENIWPKLSLGIIRDFSHGIAHFGDVFFDGLVHSPAEVMINIYDSSPTSFEQGIPSWRNVFDANALWDWDANSKSNWFSVSVSEPTPWKILKVCTNACMDFVSSAEPIMTQSTVFFGKYWWPFNYAWKESILDSTFESSAVNETAKQANVKMKSEYNSETNSTFLQELAKFLKSGLIPGAFPHSFLPESLDTLLKLKSTEISQILNTEGIVGSLLGTFGVPYKLAKGFVDSQYGKFSNTPAQQNRLNEIDLFKDVDYLVSHMYWKPFSQFHIVSSELNLLDNNIEANSNEVYTDAIGQHTYNGVLSSDSIERTCTWCVDDDIQVSDRKTMLVDTGLYVTGFQAGLLPQAFRSITSASPIGWIPGANEYINGVPKTPGVENSVVTALVNSVKEMYQGWITITGTPSIKPQDMLSFSDKRTNLSGPLGVKEVIHRLDSEVGFLTLISPDCVSMAQTNIQGARILTAVQASVLAQTATLWGMKNHMVALRWAGKRLFDKTNAQNLFRLLQLEQIKSILDDPATKPQNLIETLVKLSDEVGSIVRTLPASLGDNSVEANSLLTKLYKLYGIDVSDSLILSPDEARKLRNPLELDEIKQATKLLEALAKTENFPVNSLQDILKLSNQVSLIDLNRMAAISKLSESYQDQLKYMETFRSQAKEALIGGNLLGSARDVDKALDKLELDEWIKFLNQNKDLLEEVSVMQLNSEEVLQNLLSRYPTLIDKMDELKSIINKKGVITEDDIKILKLILDLDIVQLYEPTFIDESLLQALSKQNNYAGLLNVFLGNQTDPRFNGSRNILGRAKSTEEVANDLTAAGKIRASWDKVKKITKAIKAKDLEGAKAAVKLSEETLEALKFSKMLTKFTEFGKASITTIRVAQYAGPQAIIALAKDVVWVALGSSILDAFNNQLKARQCVKIFPLSNRGIPFIAGIRGHQGAVVGDDPGLLDRLLASSLGGKPAPGEISSGAFVFTSVLGGLLGVEVPDYYPSPADEEYIKSQNK